MPTVFRPPLITRARPPSAPLHDVGAPNLLPALSAARPYSLTDWPVVRSRIEARFDFAIQNLLTTTLGVPFFQSDWPNPGVPSAQYFHTLLVNSIIPIDTASSPYVGPMGRYREGWPQQQESRPPHLWPLPHVRDRGPTQAEDQEELREMAAMYFEWLDELSSAPSVEEIHALADSKGVKWDNAPAFMAMTKRLTGKEHLDDMTPSERVIVADWLRRKPWPR